MSRYNLVSENVNALFGGSVKSWDINKVKLASWCRFYDYIKSSYDKSPPEDVYNNDYKLDRWEKQKKLERRNKDNASAGTGPRDKPLADEFDSGVIKQ